MKTILAIHIHVIGPHPNRVQDSFMYRSQNGVRSVLLDDDNCDCLSTLSMGHGMCNSGFSTSYGPAQRFGVDVLYDTHCQTPDPKHGLSLYFRGTLGTIVHAGIGRHKNNCTRCSHECYLPSYKWALPNF